MEEIMFRPRRLLFSIFIILAICSTAFGSSFMSKSGVSTENYNNAVDILEKVYIGEFAGEGRQKAEAIPTGTGESIVLFPNKENVYLTPYHYISLQKALNELDAKYGLRVKSIVWFFFVIACLICWVSVFLLSWKIFVGGCCFVMIWTALYFLEPCISSQIVEEKLLAQIQSQTITRNQIPQLLQYLDKYYAELSNTGTLLRENTVIEREISYSPVHRDNPTIIFMPGMIEHYKEETEAKEEPTNIVIPIRPSWER